MVRFLVLAAALPLAAAHFKLDYPPARGFDEDNLIYFPCGKQDSVSSNRTEWGIKGGPIDLTMGHDQAAVQVLLGLGNNPGVNFNITLEPTFLEQGLGSFCMPDVVVPGDLGISDGMNATIQVVTNGDPNGGLYNCADITFRTAPAPSPSCTNNTGIATTSYTGRSKNANQTNTDSNQADSAITGSPPSGTASSTATAASPGKTGAASTMRLKEDLLALAMLVVLTSCALLW
ncbi:MAG: hypothetical protein M1838_005027 [Thelocarpon superellum]|nr:MAG: hypothetical protein M1838_005027 [Thelocarpon superellum]